MAKNIIICCDGTANQYGKNNTNVVKLYEIILIDAEQVNFYDPGVGTSSNSWFARVHADVGGVPLISNKEIDWVGGVDAR